MHSSVTSYLTTLADKRRSPHTLKAARRDLARFVAWWEQAIADPDRRGVGCTTNPAWYRIKVRRRGMATLHATMVTHRVFSYSGWIMCTRWQRPPQNPIGSEEPGHS
jgi:hypothetical protein